MTKLRALHNGDLKGIRNMGKLNRRIIAKQYCANNEWA